MPSQTLIFVPLPNGLGANNTLKLSLYLTPRLDGGATAFNRSRQPLAEGAVAIPLFV